MSQHDVTSSASSSVTPMVTVIMRTKDSAWVVDRALAGLFSQQGISFELLVVDSGSSDNTLELVRQYPHRLIEIQRDSYVPGPVLNQAIATVTTPWVAFQNSDVVPLRCDVLKRLIEDCDKPQVAATYARQLPRPEAWQAVQRDHSQAFPDSGEAPAWLPLSLPMAVARRELLVAHPFSSQTWASEDTEWGYRMRSLGWQTRYVPQAWVMHSHNYTLSELRGRKFVEGEADAFLMPQPTTALTSLRRCAAESLRDLWWCSRAKAWSQIPGSLVRRAVGHWSYRQGMQLGMCRKQSLDLDPSTGQQIALAHHRH